MQEEVGERLTTAADGASPVFFVDGPPVKFRFGQRGFIRMSFPEMFQIAFIVGHSRDFIQHIGDFSESPFPFGAGLIAIHAHHPPITPD